MYGVFPVKSRGQNLESIKGVSIIAIFSSNLRRLRKDANLTQVNLAEKADLAPNFINDIENVKKWVSAESLGKLANALEVEPSQFFISSPIWNNQSREIISLFLSDFEKMSQDYRKRFLVEDTGEQPV